MSLRSDIEAIGALIRVNPATGERGFQVILRRVHSVEIHMRNFEDRFADLENRLNDHSQGTKHRPKTKLPEADKE